MPKEKHNLTIGQQIRQIRESKKMTLTELSQLSNVAIGTLGDLERTRITNPSFVTVARVCKALNISPLLLLGDTDSEFAQEATTKDIEYLFDLEYLNFFRDPDFKRYFEVARQAFEAGVSPESLVMMVNALAAQKQG